MNAESLTWAFIEVRVAMLVSIQLIFDPEYTDVLGVVLAEIHTGCLQSATKVICLPYKPHIGSFRSIDMFSHGSKKNPWAVTKAASANGPHWR